MFSTTPAGQSLLTVHAADGSSITVHEQGAHISSWRTSDGKELLYTSPNALYKKGTAIRGGVPIIFPQFSNKGSLPSHGYGRVRDWAVSSVGQGAASFELRVTPDDAVTPGADLRVLYKVSFSNSSLDMSLAVQNQHASCAFEFTCALHTYFKVADISKLVVKGLDSIAFNDTLDKGKQCVAAPVGSIDKEVDRVYPAVSGPIELLVDGSTRLSVSGKHMPDVVLWNPWIAKTRGMKDMPEDGYKNFVCVEHGSIEQSVNVAPGQTWCGSQQIVVLQ